MSNAKKATYAKIKMNYRLGKAAHCEIIGLVACVPNLPSPKSSLNRDWAAKIKDLASVGLGGGLYFMFERQARWIGLIGVLSISTMHRDYNDGILLVSDWVNPAP